MTDYSQSGEQAALLEYFASVPKGRFCDVGSWEGKTFSNSYALAQRGWSGVCVEPSPKAFIGLMENHRDRSDILLANVAVAAGAGLADFHDSNGDALSTLNVGHTKNWPQVKFRTFAVATVTPAMLLARFGNDFDLLSLDVEGNSADLLYEFPLAEMPVLSAIVVEHDGRADELAEWVRPMGFYEVKRNGENVIFVR